jgi:hypothetical protein
MQSYVIVHLEDGIFIGIAMGMAFWSECDHVGQTHACAFSSAQAAQEFIDKVFPASLGLWCEPKPVLTVLPDFASTEELCAAGLKAWVNEATPTVGPMQ